MELLATDDVSQILQVAKVCLWRTMELNERQMLSVCSSCVCSFVAALAHWPVKVKPALMTLRYAKIIPQGAKSFLLFLLMQHSPTEEKINKYRCCCCCCDGIFIFKS